MIPLNISGASSFLTLMNCLLPNIPSLDLLQELYPACSVLIFCLLILKSLSLLTELLSLKSILFMPSSVDLISVLLPVLILSMIFPEDFGIRILIIFLLISALLKRKKWNSLSRKILKPNLLRRLPLTSYLNHWKQILFPLMTSLMHPSLRFTALSFWLSSYPNGSLVH